MSTVINSLNAFCGATLGGHVQPTASRSAAGRVTMASRALAGMRYNRSDDTKARALEKSLSLFFDETVKLRDFLNSFSSSVAKHAHRTRTVSVSDAEKLRAYVGAGATPAVYEVNIDRLAVVQTNRSIPLASGDIAEFDEGTYAFSLTVGDKRHSLQVTVDKTGAEPDTNKDVLKKLAYEIDRAADDVEAFVTEGERKVYSSLSDDLFEDIAYLTVRNRTTGNDTYFALSDDTGNIIDTLKIDHVAESGQACRYRLNGTEHASDSNTISTDHDRMSITFTDVTVSPVTVAVTGGPEAIRKKFADLISACNDYIHILDQNAGYITPAVKTDLIKEIGTIAQDLYSIGLRLEANGKILQTDKFDQALQSEMSTVNRIFTGDNGFLTKVRARLTEVLENGVQAYGINQDSFSEYNEKGLFKSLKRINEITLYA